MYVTQFNYKSMSFKVFKDERIEKRQLASGLRFGLVQLNWIHNRSVYITGPYLDKFLKFPLQSTKQKWKTLIFEKVEKYIFAICTQS